MNVPKTRLSRNVAENWCSNCPLKLSHIIPLCIPCCIEKMYFTTSATPKLPAPLCLRRTHQLRWGPWLRRTALRLKKGYPVLFEALALPDEVQFQGAIATDWGQMFRLWLHVATCSWRKGKREWKWLEHAGRCAAILDNVGLTAPENFI